MARRHRDGARDRRRRDHVHGRALAGARRRDPHDRRASRSSPRSAASSPSAHAVRQRVDDGRACAAALLAAELVARTRRRRARGRSTLVPAGLVRDLRRCTASSRRSPTGSSVRSPARCVPELAEARNRRDDPAPRRAARPRRAGLTSAGCRATSTFLGATLLPVTLAVGAVRYWLVGLTGAAHPATARHAQRRRHGRARRLPVDRRADRRGRRTRSPTGSSNCPAVARRAAADHRRPVRRRAADRRRRRVRRVPGDRRRRLRRRAVRGAGADDGGARGADRRRAAADRDLRDPGALTPRARTGPTHCWPSRWSRSAGRSCSRPPARCAWTPPASPAAPAGCPDTSQPRSPG